MGILTPELIDFLDGERVGVLATASSRGKPRQSLVYFVRDGDRLLISTLSDRLKAQDVRTAAIMQRITRAAANYIAGAPVGD